MNYKESKEILNQDYTQKREGNKYRKLANNTYLEEREDYNAVILHDTEIIKLYPDYFVLNSGGYKTFTTKDRMNRFSNVHLIQENYIWYIGDWQSKDLVYQDGIKFDYKGNILSGQADESLVTDTKKMNDKIKEFCNVAVRELEKGIPLPSGGDCWYCLMQTEEGENLGDATKDHSHLLSHIEEEYIVPSLLFTAVVEAGYNTPEFILGVDLETETMGNRSFSDPVKRALRNYLQKRLL